jgi:putative tricarboxylic transport membrane protein
VRLHDTLLGALLIALALAVFGYTFTFPAFGGQKYGPSLFPRLIAVGIALCGLAIAWRGWKSGAPWVRFDDKLRQGRRLVSFFAIPGATLLYLLLAERLGFLPVAAALVGALAWWFGVKHWRALLLGVATALLMQWFFGRVMRVPLPRGWFMQILFGG